MSSASKARTRPNLRAIVIDEEAALEPYLDAWDRLAVAAGRPFCAPAWMLAWWRNARSGDARLRVALALDGERLVGVGPFFAQIAYGLNELRLLAAGFCHRLGPLAEEGLEQAVASAIAPALAATQPRPASVVFEGVDSGEGWPELFAQAWPGRRPRLRTDAEMKAPVVDMSDSYDAWLQRLPGKFRGETRRMGRRLEEAGVKQRVGADEESVRALVRLHHARWDERGGASVDERAERVVEDAMRSLGPQGRLRIVLLEGPEGPISAALTLRAGRVATFWAGGFDAAWSRYSPGMQTNFAALSAAAEAGAELADFGGGDLFYKDRLTDLDMPIAWRTLFPRGPRYPLIRLRLAPKHARLAAREAARRMPAPARGKLQALRRKLKRR